MALFLCAAFIAGFICGLWALFIVAWAWSKVQKSGDIQFWSTPALTHSLPVIMKTEHDEAQIEKNYVLPRDYFDVVEGLGK